jgi:hypothetical protein
MGRDCPAVAPRSSKPLLPDDAGHARAEQWARAVVLDLRRLAITGDKPPVCARFEASGSRIAGPGRIAEDRGSRSDRVTMPANLKAGRRRCRTADRGADSPGRRLGGPIAHAQAHSHRGWSCGGEHRISKPMRRACAMGGTGRHGGPGSVGPCPPPIMPLAPRCRDHAITQFTPSRNSHHSHHSEKSDHARQAVPVRVSMGKCRAAACSSLLFCCPRVRTTSRH